MRSKHIFHLHGGHGEAGPGKLGKGFGIGRSTAYRYRDETVAVLAEQAPDLHDALEYAAGQGFSHLNLDGKLFESDRVDEQTTSVKGHTIDLWYSGKHRRQGGNIQALSIPCGLPLWLAYVEPGSVHDLTAAREHVLGALYWANSQLGLPTLADGGYIGTGIGVHTPIKQPTTGELHPDTRTYNALLRGLRCLGERGFAVLVGKWRALRRITVSPEKIGDITKAALTLTLTHFEHGIEIPTSA